MTGPRRWGRRVWRLALSITAALVVVALLLTIPTPYVLRAPGRALDVAPMIRIADHPWTATPGLGKLLVTTVILEPANLLYCLYGLFDSQAELIPRKSMGAEYFQAGDVQMDRSEYLAKVAALLYLGYELNPDPKGALVLSTVSGGVAEGVLAPGDLITEVDGRRIFSAEGLMEAIGRLPAGASVTLTYFRGGAARTSSLVPRLMTLPDGKRRRLLGIQIRTELELARLPVDIEIEAGNVSGASAGLVFALGIVDRLSEEDITGGQIVAGTGTLDGAGRVGPVSGAPLKLVAASRAGARVFLCPRENEPELSEMKVRLKVQVIAVDDLAGAVAALRKSARTAVTGLRTRFQPETPGTV